MCSEDKSECSRIFKVITTCGKSIHRFTYDALKNMNSNQFVKRLGQQFLGVFGGGGSYLAVVRGYSWPCAQESLLTCSGDRMGCQGLNLGQNILPAILSLWPLGVF